MYKQKPDKKLAKWLGSHYPGHSRFFIHGFFSGLILAPAPLQPSSWLGQLLSDHESKTLPAWVIMDLMDLNYQFQQAACEGELKLPAKCSVPKANPIAVFEEAHPLHSWSKGCQRAVQLWPPLDQLSQQAQLFFAVMALDLMFFKDEARARTVHREQEVAVDFETEIRQVRRRLSHHLEHFARLASCRYVELFDQFTEMEEEYLGELADDAPRSKHRSSDNRADGWEDRRQMALLERDPVRQLSALDSLIADARATLGDAFLTSLEGDGWYHPEVRPLLRAMADRTQLLLNANRLDEARETMYELLKLNNNDNQGIRFALMELLVRQQRWHDLETLLENYEEPSASNLYTRTLMLFALQGDSEPTRQALTEAYKTNQYVPALLLGQDRLPQTLPEFFAPGNKDEAILYAHTSKRTWQQTDGALFWLRSRLKK